MTHWLYANMPTTFAAWVPIYGLPLTGFATVPTSVAPSSIMALHDRSDTVIPASGGWAGGWNYSNSD